VKHRQPENETIMGNGLSSQQIIDRRPHQRPLGWVPNSKNIYPETKFVVLSSPWRFLEFKEYLIGWLAAALRKPHVHFRSS